MAQLFLEIEQVFEVGVVSLAPDLGAARGLDQLHGNTDAIAGLADAALDQVVDVQFRGDFTGALDLLFEGEARIARLDLQVRKQGQVEDDAVGDAVAEVFLFRVARQVVERQHRDAAACL